MPMEDDEAAWSEESFHQCSKVRTWPAWSEENDVDPFPPIDDYGIIGDCRTAGLIAISGAIEWLCLPDFSGPSVFGAILDRARGGAFLLRPETACESRRRYLPETGVLETTFTTAGGRVRVLDFMPIRDGNRRWNADIAPQRELIRIVEGLEGSVDLVTIIDPRPDYGRERANIVRRSDFGWLVEGPGSLMTFRTDFVVELDRNGTRLAGRTTVSAGVSRTVSFAFTQHEIAAQPVIGVAARSQLKATVVWWRAWAGRCVFTGSRRDLVVRSAITLKLLTYALSGAVVAAVTTSLPEALGFGRNWDYRFCWLRDASVTVHAFLGLGLQDEADAFLGWTLHATRLTRPELRILYDLHGRNTSVEVELGHLEGYCRSRPVRVGNGAASQLQLDTYGSVIHSAYEYIAAMGSLSGGEMRLLRDFGEVICRRWQEPDHGLWEVRGEPRRFTATLVMCWTALDRLIRLGEEGRVKIPIARFRQNRDAIVALIEERGFSEAVGAYVAEIDGAADAVPDAAVLLMGFVGYGDPSSDRMKGTLRWIMGELGRDGLLARYPTGYDGERSREGAFGICLAWAIMFMVRSSSLDEAVRALDRYAETANDLGLFAEEYDDQTNASLGNFPQAFTHAGYVAAALAVERATTRADR